MSAPSLVEGQLRSVRVCIAGRVQGLGIRPAALRLASRWGLSGSIANTTSGVILELMGPAASLEACLAALPQAIPMGATIDNWQVESIAPVAHEGFRIADSSASGNLAATVPGDTIACADCLAEVRDPCDRRHAYPLTSCTSCGPRYSVLTAMPYDRDTTSLRNFPLCSQCSSEYRSQDNRRFHAQTIACAQCGPRVWFKDAAGRTYQSTQALLAAADVIRSGRILALKGLGGYQLLADATSSDAVARLRRRKLRPTKPLAVLVSSLEEASVLAEWNGTEYDLLSAAAGPIVVLRRRADGPLANNIAPGFSSVGVMLPTTPLHALLCDHVARPLVCTSGNREGEPLVYEEASAEIALSGIADAWLHHNRPIVRPVDDSVVRVIGGERCFLRLARGYAPLPLPWSSTSRAPMIALGGEQKAAIACFNGAQAILGPHVGDLTTASTCERWEEQVASLAALYGLDVNETTFAHDRHPEYYSTQWATQHATCVGVQHHHAHVAAVMLEHGALDREVLGLAWDGTGYGDDGTVWGGESLRATAQGYQRVAWLRPFPLIGGELAIREPWRVAVALVYAALGPEVASQLHWPEVSPTHIHHAVTLAGKPRLSIQTSSMGRLFDGVAALVLGISNALDDGRPAMLLEEVCDQTAVGEYSFATPTATGPLDWRPVVTAIMADLRQRTSPGVIAMRFHRAVADLAIAQAGQYPQLPLVTAGGVFQNAVLLELFAERCLHRRTSWLRPQSIPPGDGGLAVGQLAIAAARTVQLKD